MDKEEKEKAEKLIDEQVNANIESDEPITEPISLEIQVNILSKKISNIITQLSILQAEILMLKKKMKL